MDVTLQQKQVYARSWKALHLGGVLVILTTNFGAVCSIFRVIFDLLSLSGVRATSLIQWPHLLNVPTLSVCAALYAYICARKRWHVTTKSTVQTLPFHFVETTFWITLLLVATFLPLAMFYTFIPRILLSFTVVMLDLQLIGKTRKIAPKTTHVLPEQKKPVCSVCQRASIYEVCMDCERTHHREIQRVRSQNWRAKKADEPATLTIAEWLQALEFFHYHCAYCQTRPYELMEHYYPIGSNHVDGGTTAKNCVPGCYKCNASKSNKSPDQ